MVVRNGCARVRAMSPSHPQAGREAALRVRESNADWTAATVANVMITIMWKRATAGQMRRLREIHDEWYRAHPQGIATFNVVLPSTLIPEADAHIVAADALGAMQGHHLASTTVILGGGFWAATMRSVLTTMFAVSRSRVPQKVVGTIEEGVMAQSRLLGSNGPAHAAFLEACNSLIDEHRKRHGSA